MLSKSQFSIETIQSSVCNMHQMSTRFYVIFNRPSVLNHENMFYSSYRAIEAFTTSVFHMKILHFN